MDRAREVTGEPGVVEGVVAERHWSDRRPGGRGRPQQGVTSAPTRRRTRQRAGEAGQPVASARRRHPGTRSRGSARRGSRACPAQEPWFSATRSSPSGERRRERRHGGREPDGERDRERPRRRATRRAHAVTSAGGAARVCAPSSGGAPATRSGRDGEHGAHRGDGHDRLPDADQRVDADHRREHGAERHGPRDGQLQGAGDRAGHDREPGATAVPIPGTRAASAAARACASAHHEPRAERPDDAHVQDVRARARRPRRRRTGTPAPAARPRAPGRRATAPAGSPPARRPGSGRSCRRRPGSSASAPRTRTRRSHPAAGPGARRTSPRPCAGRSRPPRPPRRPSRRDARVEEPVRDVHARSSSRTPGTGPRSGSG